MVRFAKADVTMDQHSLRRTTFELLNEIGIVYQLSSAEFNRCMPEGLHISHFIVINHLFRIGDGRTPAQIAESIQVTRATMTHTLTKLSKLEFIELKDHPVDGRRKLVFLTKRGRAFQKRAITALEPLLDDIAQHLDADALTGLLPVLRSLRAFLDTRRS